MIETIQIDNHTWRFEDGFVRFFLLEGDERSALIDSGVNSPDAAELAAKLTDKPLLLLNTHGDGDHTSGTSAFKRIHIHELDYINCELGKRYPQTALAPLNDNDIIDLGNRPIRAIHIPGHTSGSMAFLDVNRRSLYAGDSVQKGHIYMFGDKREPDRFEASLTKLIQIKNEYDCIYASHDEAALESDYAEKVRSAWIKVRNGEVPYEAIELFGKKVKSYTTQDCGFFME